MIGRSTGGLIAIELARRFPDKVKALVLLDPALFTIAPDADAWARGLRRRVLERTDGQPGLVAETVIREALGNATWESLPAGPKQMFAGTSHAWSRAGTSLIPPIRLSWTSSTATPDRTLGPSTVL